VLPWRTTYVNFRTRQPVTPLEDDDLALVQRAKGGDMEAFRSLVVRYQRKVYAVALGIVRDADLAWDVSQDVFVRVHRSLDGFKGESSFFTWLFRIATHVSIDSVRKERVAQRDEVDELRESDLADAGEGILATPLGNDPGETLLRRELAGKMAAALATLPEKHRTILVLREVEGLSYDELAERLGIHKGTVMSRLFHARRKMQAALRSYTAMTPAREATGTKVEGESTREDEE
jgi:RNA polymerase sigma-70 factor, ECF subfamily